MKVLKICAVLLAVYAVFTGKAAAGVQSFTFQQGDPNDYRGTEDTFVRWGVGGDVGLGNWYHINFARVESYVVGVSVNRKGRAIVRFNDVFGPGPNQIPLGTGVQQATLTMTVGADQLNRTLQASPFFTRLFTYGDQNETTPPDGGREPTGRYKEYHSNSQEAVDWALPCISGAQCGPIDAVEFPAVAHPDWDSAHPTIGTGSAATNVIEVDVTSLVRDGYLTNHPVTGLQGNGILLHDVNDAITTYRSAEHANTSWRPLLTVVVPEPASCVLLAIGALIMTTRRRRCGQASNASRWPRSTCVAQ